MICRFAISDFAGTRSIWHLTVAWTLAFSLACGSDSEPSVQTPEAPAESVPARTRADFTKALSLRAGEPCRQRILTGETHLYPLDLERGDFLHFEVEQLAGDVYLEISSPSGRAYPRIDSAADATRIESLFLLAEESGEFLLRVGAFEPGSEYEARLDPTREPSQEDRSRTEANWRFHEARSLRQTDPVEAAAKYRDAIERWERLKEWSLAARAHYELGEVLPRAPEQREDRVAAYDRARTLFEQVGDLRQAARCLHRLGGIAAKRSDLKTSHELFARSLELWREVGNLHEVSTVAYDLANVAQELGRPEEARRNYLAALDVTQHNRWPLLHEAAIRTELGALYFYRGEAARGIREYRAALRILDLPPQGDGRRIKNQRARTLTRLGSALPALPGATAETLEEARTLLDEARRLREELGEHRGIAVTANSLGLLYEKMNRPQSAFEAYQQAEEIFRAQGSATDLAVVQGNRCRILERLGKLDAARSCFLSVIADLRKVGFRNAEAQALGDLAGNARHRGELHEASRRIHEAIEVLELIRNESHSSDLRSSFLARKYDAYQRAIDIALELHELEPQAGHMADAFYDLERASARGLLEMLVRYRPELEAPPRLHELRAEIHQLKSASLATEGTATDDVDRLEIELDMLLERLHLTSPRYAFVEPRILSIAGVQELLDPQTVLLEYHLGERRSAVWAITDSQVVWRPLPPQHEIEETARELHQVMSAGAHKIRQWAFDRLSRELSQMILAPVADLLDRPRLAVVPAGALRYIPFAALPHPAGLAGSKTKPTQPEPLLLTHQITSTPSASVLAALRERGAGRAPAGKLLALVAAPVMRSDDKRLAGSPVSGDQPLRQELVAPLPHAAEEATAILQLVEGAAVSSALGFEANREFVFGGALADARIVHFATHGYLDDAHGELSGLVLAQFDDAGRRIDGYLWAYEIYQLDLRADLVVLSACETALGEAIRGEGLVGLTQGFLYAGANRVMVSLWSVNDRATARLMKHFYRGLLRHGLHPAEALRQAQIELRREGWTAPYYWAPFVLQGDWSAVTPP